MAETIPSWVLLAVLGILTVLACGWSLGMGLMLGCMVRRRPGSNDGSVALKLDFQWQRPSARNLRGRWDRDMQRGGELEAMVGSRVQEPGQRVPCRNGCGLSLIHI